MNYNNGDEFEIIDYQNNPMKQRLFGMYTNDYTHQQSGNSSSVDIQYYLNKLNEQRELLKDYAELC